VLRASPTLSCQQGILGALQMPLGGTSQRSQAVFRFAPAFYG